MNIQDQGSDISEQALYQFTDTLQDVQTKNYIQAISGDLSKNFSKVASDNFAIPEFRKFPMHTTEDCVLSMAYLKSQENTLPTDLFAKTAEALGNKLSLYDSSILEELSFETEMVFEKKAGDYGYLLPQQEFFKIASSDDVLAAEKLFEKKSEDLNLADKIEYCTNLYKTAQELEIPITYPKIISYSGECGCDMQQVKVALSLREGLAARKGVDGTEFTKLGSALSEAPENPSFPELLDLVGVLSGIDKTAGFTERDYKKIPDPVLSVFNKTAENTEPKSQENQKLTNKDKEDAALKHMTKSEIIGRFGDDILPEIEEADGKINIDMLKHVKKISDAHKGGNNG